MGKYINVVNGTSLPVLGKAEKLIELGATKIAQPTEFQENLVFVNNPSGMFESAVYLDTKSEFDYFRNTFPNKGTWLIFENAAQYAR